MCKSCPILFAAFRAPAQSSPNELHPATVQQTVRDYRQPEYSFASQVLSQAEQPRWHQETTAITAVRSHLFPPIEPTAGQFCEPIESSVLAARELFDAELQRRQSSEVAAHDDAQVFGYGTYFLIEAATAEYRELLD